MIGVSGAHNQPAGGKYRDTTQFQLQCAGLRVRERDDDGLRAEHAVFDPAQLG
jgi:hypothetical protein